MYTFIVVLIVIICILLSLIVLVQNPKGGGLDATFGGVSNNTFGAKQTTDFLEKGTWYLAIALLVLSLGASLYVSSKGTVSDRAILQDIEATDQPAAPADGEGTLPITTPLPGDDNSETPD